MDKYYREKYYANHPGDLSTIDSDLIESKRQLELAVSQKYVPALKLISNNYASGQGGYTIDYDNAIKYLKIASALNPDKLSDLERQYYLTTDFQKRIGELTKIKNGLASSDQETLLRESIKLLEHGTKEDKQNALKMLESAASAGYVDAQYQLGKLYATGNSAIPKDIDTAISWWEKAASQKNIASMEELAYGYTDGKYSIAIDLDMAVNLSEELFKYYASIPNEPGSSDSVRAWRVNMCNAINSIKRNRGDSYTIPKDKVRHCMRF